MESSTTASDPAMNSDDDKPNIDELARAALVAFLRRVFTQLANTRQAESLELRAELERLK